MSKSVKTSGDWMTLFLGSRSRDLDTGRSYSSPYSSSHNYSASSTRYSPSSTRYSPERSGRYSPVTDYGGRYGGQHNGTDVTSPTQYRRSHSYTTASNYRHLSQYSSRWAESEAEQETTGVASRLQGTSSRQQGTSSRLQGTTNNTHSGSEASRDSQETPAQDKPRGRVTVLNQGTIMIRRPGRIVDSSDEEEEKEEEVEEEEKEEEPPPRDPLEVEEEELTSKLQTAGFLLSLPEEEQARRRLVEIRQIRENPELFRPENSRDWKFSQVSAQLGKPSAARAEEEKILLLRLSSRGISEVEQTDIQVRLQEVWRDRQEEVEAGLGRLEQEYEHHLTETSTELEELEGSIRGKQAAIAKLQEELLVLSLRKERISADMEKVTTNHQGKVEELNQEVNNLKQKSSQYSVVVKTIKKEESSLPEDERSEIEAELECPVCLEISRPPIYQCGEGHIICSACKPLLRSCCVCETKYSDPPIRCRFAEKLAAKYFREDAD